MAAPAQELLPDLPRFGKFFSLRAGKTNRSSICCFAPQISTTAEPSQTTLGAAKSIEALTWVTGTQPPEPPPSSQGLCSEYGSGAEPEWNPGTLMLDMHIPRHLHHLAMHL